LPDFSSAASQRGFLPRPAQVSDVTVAFSDTSASQLQQHLISVANFGMSDAFPVVASVLSDQNKKILLEQARNIARRMTEIKTDAGNALSNAASIDDSEKEKKREYYGCSCR
jgi:hypothetical protein